MKANEILRQAADVIEQRALLRDTPDGERSMRRAVDAFNTLVGGDRRLTELEGWMFMSVLKLARATAGEPHIDDMVDLCGYAALAAECMESGGPEPHGHTEDGMPFYIAVTPQSFGIGPDGKVGGIDRSGTEFWKNNDQSKCCNYPNPSADKKPYCLNCGHTY